MERSLRESCAEYILKCRQVLIDKDIESARKLRLEATQRFYSVIPNWECGLMASITHFYLDDIESILHKLLRFQEQLDKGQNFEIIKLREVKIRQSHSWDHHQRHMVVDSFSKTYLWILDNYPANSREIIDILNKVDELQNIASQQISKSQRWEQLKTILDWIESRNAELAARFLPLITNMLSE